MFKKINLIANKIYLFGFLISIFSCNKIINQNNIKATIYQPIPTQFFKEGKIPGVSLQNNSHSVHAGRELALPVDLNNGEDQLILGNQLPNPYTVSNMQAAYNILYTTPTTITANFMYVKLSQQIQIS